MDTFTPGEAAGPMDVPLHSKNPMPRRRRVLVWCRDVIYIPSRDPLEAGYLFSVTALRTRLVICTTEGCTQSSATCAKFLGILGILGIFGISNISNNIIIISTIMLHITTYIVIDPLSRVIRTYIRFFTTLSIVILILKTNNLDDISKHTLNLALNSHLR